MILKNKPLCLSLVKKEKKFKLYHWIWLSLLIKAGVDIFGFLRNRYLSSAKK